jgi:RimJ/RimL family protein N-acetyltransferase
MIGAAKKDRSHREGQTVFDQRTLRLKNGQDAILRSATPNDAESWVANVSAIGAEWIYLMTEIFRRTPDQVREQFRDADPTSTLWLVGELEGKVVAGADFHRGIHSKNAHTASLGVAVRREFRGLGFGEALMRAGTEWARSVGVTRLKLGVFATNRPALSLYQKLGFVEEGRLKGEVILDGRPVDEVLMALSL